MKKSCLLGLFLLAFCFYESEDVFSQGKCFFSQGIITGPQAVSMGTGGLIYSTTPVSNATNLVWTVPDGWVITSGQGTNAITVTAGTTYGNIMFIGYNECGIVVAQRALLVIATNIPVSVSISSNPVGAVCSGTPVSFNATPVNGGSSPVFQWRVNGANVGGNSSTYSYVPANNDAVNCKLTSSLQYAVNNPATSNTVTISTTFTINHVVGVVAPVTKTVTYGTVTNIVGEPTKCWITSNLGSDHQATSVNDVTEASAGWYWQFNRKQGYKHDGTTRTPNSTWITSINENSDWLTANDPCIIELGTGWRIPTYTEWSNVLTSGGWTNWNGPWNSGLKMHAAGFLSSTDGSLFHRPSYGSFGYYWSSTQFNAAYGWNLFFSSVSSSVSNYNKAYGFTLRCLRDY